MPISVFFLTAFLGFSAFSFLAFYFYRKFYCHRFFSRLGIPGPKPHFFYGNLQDLWRHDRHLVVQKWAQQYGDVFGIYEGSDPVLVLAGVEGVDQVCLKQSSSFGARQIVGIQPDPDLRPNDPWCNMFMARGDHWRRPRTAASPFFSSKRLRLMAPCLEKNCNKFLETLATKDGNKVSKDGVITIRCARNSCQRFALQFLGEIAFSLDLKLLDTETSGDDSKVKKSGEAIFEACQGMFATFANNLPLVFKIMTALPFVASIMEFFARFAIRFFPASSNRSNSSASEPVELEKQDGLFGPINALLQTMSSIVASRRDLNGSQMRNDSLPDWLLRSSANETKNSRDLVQMLSDIFVTTRNTTSDGTTMIEKKPFLTDEQLRVNLTGFLMAGYETSGTTLSTLCYLLATHPEVQDKLVQEIQDVLSEGIGEERLKDYDVLMSRMKYLDAVVNETARLYPAAVNLITRKQADDETNICGYNIPKASIKMVQVDAYTIHQNPELWGPVDPKMFHPERFLDDYPTAPNRPICAFLPFGVGPRQCLGIRLVMFEIKFAIVHLLRRYELLPISEDAPKQLPVKVDNVMMLPTIALPLKLKPRRSTILLASPSTFIDDLIMPENRHS